VAWDAVLHAANLDGGQDERDDPTGLEVNIMAEKKQEFCSVWANQSDLGKRFGLSAVALGRKHTEFGLKGQDNQPTQRALDGGVCDTHPHAGWQAVLQVALPAHQRSAA
jgi:hypothetical protein